MQRSCLHIKDMYNFTDDIRTKKDEYEFKMSARVIWEEGESYENAKLRGQRPLAEWVIENFGNDPLNT